MFFWYYLQFFILTLKSLQAKILNIFLPKICTFGENTSKYCSWIIVVHVQTTVFFLKLTHIVNGIKAGSDSKKTDKHAADCSKAVYWGRKMIYVRCIKCSCNNVAKGIRLLDKKTTFFLFIQEKFHASNSF